MRYYEKILHDIIYVLNYVRSTYIRKLYKLRDEKKIVDLPTVYILRDLTAMAGRAYRSRVYYLYYII